MSCRSIAKNWVKRLDCSAAAATSGCKNRANINKSKQVFGNARNTRNFRYYLIPRKVKNPENDDSIFSYFFSVCDRNFREMGGWASSHQADNKWLLREILFRGSRVFFSCKQSLFFMNESSQWCLQTFECLQLKQMGMFRKHWSAKWVLSRVVV